MIQLLKKGITSYRIPLSISNKSGILNWDTLGKKKPLNGQIKNNSQTQGFRQWKTYLGPPSIEAGGKDYTMLVVIPTDTLDNPLKKRN